MYEVQMKYMSTNNIGESINFTCEKFGVNDNGYKFENIFMDNFKLTDLEIKKEDIALIKIK